MQGLYFWMKNVKPRLVFSVLLALGAILMTWLLQGESSPLADYFLWHPGLRNFWAILNVVPYIIAEILTDESIVLFTILQFIQWFIIGFVLWSLFVRRRLR